MAQQSLYRRYRPRRFGELRGQDHVVQALRNAVAQHREGQAYLFSGPRGTGKTTSARILAKVLNCERPEGGEPCCECASCVAVEAGTSFDVIELDAASNNKVDDIRDLIERVNLGTPGRHKVYILDEVHMLTPGAEAALLKTLEEPPPHVVFVLATTDPQKVRDTIRSRTQQLTFHLLPEKELAAHVRWVAEDAGIELSEEALEAVMRQGGGSARDTLSALEVVAAGGGIAVEAAPLDEFLEAMIEADPGRALAAVAVCIHQGRDARGVADSVLAHLRDCFLSLMAPELVQLSDSRAAVVADQARRLGAASAVRAMEGLGDALVEMRHAPDPRVLLEVALVKLTSAPLSTDVAALLVRLERLEQAVANGAAARVAPASSASSASPAAEPSTGRAVLGGRARGGAPAPAVTVPAAASVEPPAVTPAVAPAPAAGTPAADLAAVFEHDVKPGLKGAAKAIYLIGKATVADDALVVTFPNDGHAKRAGELRPDIERAMGQRVGRAVRVVVASDGSSAPADGRARAGEPADALPDEDVDVTDLVDAPANAVAAGIDRIAAAFPGSELIVEGD
jgi:DNA polymerase III subunit gamma/tau